MPPTRSARASRVLAYLAKCTPEEVAEVARVLFPRAPGSLAHRAHIGRIEQAREELGLAPLKLFDPESDQRYVVGSAPCEEGDEFHDGEDDADDPDRTALEEVNADPAQYADSAG